MSSLTRPFLNTNDEKCIVCGNNFDGDASEVSIRGWETFKRTAEEWSKIKLPFTHKYYMFTRVYTNIADKTKPEGKRHYKNVNCRITLNKKDLRKSLFKEFNENENEIATNSSLDLSRKTCPSTRSKTGITTSFVNLCFICNEVRDIDSTHKYRDCGLGTCETESAALKLTEASKKIINEDHDFYAAKQRFDIQLSGQSRDVWAAEIRYHRSCYRKFIHNAIEPIHQNNDDTKIHDFVLNNFFADLYESVVRKENTFLLSDLLKGWLSLCNEKNINSNINHSHHLKSKLIDYFPEAFGFYKTGKYVIVFSQSVNPCKYSVETLKGFGLRDLDLTKSFCNMVKRKLSEKNNNLPKFPYKPDELKSEVKKGPHCVLYNVIYLSLFERIKINDDGYASTKSSNLNSKIWSLASQWEGLLLKSPDYCNPMQVLSGITIYRLTQSKEIIQYLSKMNNCISYDDIRKQIKCWDDMIKLGERRSSKLRKHLTTHSSIDNIDQETDSLSIHFTSC